MICMILWYILVYLDAFSGRIYSQCAREVVYSRAEWSTGVPSGMRGRWINYNWHWGIPGEPATAESGRRVFLAASPSAAGDTRRLFFLRPRERLARQERRQPSLLRCSYEIDDNWQSENCTCHCELCRSAWRPGLVGVGLKQRLFCVCRKKMREVLDSIYIVIVFKCFTHNSV